MHSSAKKFFIALTVLVVVVGFLLENQIKRAFSITTTPDSTPLISPEAMWLPTTSTDPILGNPGAPITVTAYLSFGDNASAQIYKTLSSYIDLHPTDVRLVWEDYPKQSFFFGNQNLAHQAAYCARSQNAFWPFVSALYSGGGTDEAGLKKIAASLHIPIAPWWACTTNAATAQTIATAKATAAGLALGGAPLLFVDNYEVNAASNIDLGQLLSSLTAQNAPAAQSTVTIDPTSGQTTTQ